LNWQLNIIFNIGIIALIILCTVQSSLVHQFGECSLLANGKAIPNGLGNAFEDVPLDDGIKALFSLQLHLWLQFVVVK
jgi:hypothetical protein